MHANGTCSDILKLNVRLGVKLGCTRPLRNSETGLSPSLMKLADRPNSRKLLPANTRKRNDRRFLVCQTHLRRRMLTVLTAAEESRKPSR